MKNRNKENLVKWLDRLQQESWQLELVVSGFAIFLLLGAVNALENHPFLSIVAETGLRQQGAMLQLGFVILNFAVLFVLVNLVLHVLLRGIWISAIGLRYVSGDINFLALKLSPRFESFLRKRIGSFDNYIFRLENLCSVVFAFTFLIVFMLVGVALYFGFLLSIISFFQGKFGDWLGSEAAESIAITVVLIFILSSLLYLIDFVTLGRLKRVRWLSVVYYPVYRFFSFITLSTLYRPLYYNLVDNKFGRRLGFFLVPYVLFILFLFSLHIKSHLWFSFEPGEATFRKDYYDDLRPKNERISAGSIPSKFVKNGYLEVFLHYRPVFDDAILEKICPDFKPNRQSGLGTNIVFTVNGNSDDDEVKAPDSLLLCMSKLYEIQVDDTVFQKPVFKFYEHPANGEPGLLTILDLGDMKRGPHELKINKLSKEQQDGRDTLQYRFKFSVPFWIE